MATTVDPFTRTSDTTLGSTPEGYAWTAQVGTWGTDGDEGYSVTAADKDIATIDPGLANCDVSAKIPTLPAEGYWGLVGAYAGVGNYYHAQVSQSTGTLNFYRTTNGTEATVLSGIATVTVPSVIRIVRTNGNQWTVYVNGAQVGQTGTTETSFSTATLVGMRHGSTAAGIALRWDDFTAVVAVATTTYRPTSTLAAGGWTTTAASLHGALSDENTTTIITGTGV